MIWVDADMRIDRDFVQQQVDFMESRPKDVAGARGTEVPVGETTTAVLESMRRMIRDSDPGNLVGTGGSIYRLSAVRAVGGLTFG